MAKFKLTLKVTGLELQVEGSREDVSLMTQAVGQQLAGIVTPGAEVIDGQIIDTTASALPAALAPPKERRTKRRSTSSRAAAIGAVPEQSSEGAVLDWQHDPSKR